MQLYALGLNHNTAPLAIREQMVFHAEKLQAALRELTQTKPVGEAAILSTCNRTELYCSAAEPHEALYWLADYQRVKPQELKPYLYTLPKEQAVRHAFRVASGLESMVLGEPQILGQMKEAVRQAESAGTLGTAAAQTVPALLRGGQGGAHQHPDRRQRGVDGGGVGEAGRAHFSQPEGAEDPVHRRGRDDRAVRHPFRRAAAARHHRGQPHAGARRARWRTASTAARSSCASCRSSCTNTTSWCPAPRVRCRSSARERSSARSRRAATGRCSWSTWRCRATSSPKSREMDDVFLYTVDDLGQMVKTGVGRAPVGGGAGRGHHRDQRRQLPALAVVARPGAHHTRAARATPRKRAARKCSAR